MYSLAVGFCCVESKRSCCAVCLPVSYACARALTHRGEISQENWNLMSERWEESRVEYQG